VWVEKGSLCFSCGTCTNVCPTCYCFDVQDDVKWDMQSGARGRTWDSCQLAEFAMVSGGHNFRPKKEERFRHRFYRKGKYLPEKIGEVACVGCGRCVTGCVADIANPVVVYNRLLEGK
jgi:ferredoxin